MSKTESRRRRSPAIEEADDCPSLSRPAFSLEELLISGLFTRI